MSLHTRLFVGNIPEGVRDSDLREAFATYGEIINLELKNKPGSENDKRFAFITLSASNYNVESCIKSIGAVDFGGQKLYVTRARESFLERLQREREQANKKDEEKRENAGAIPKESPVINLSSKLNPPKRNIDHNQTNDYKSSKNPKIHKNEKNREAIFMENQSVFNEKLDQYRNNDKKLNSDQKRLESLKRKREEFKERKTIIKTGLDGIDKVPNKKVIFSDNDEDSSLPGNSVSSSGKINILFDEDDSDTEVNFKIKKQFEGEKGQKVLDLQSKYKSDKRFTLDERFIEEDQSGDEKHEEISNEDERVDVGQIDEKSKQLNILQDVLGVTIRTNNSDLVQKAKPKLGMLRYDPMHPDHAKFLAPVNNSREGTNKEKRSKGTLEETVASERVIEKVEASKEQFYTVSQTLKDAMTQPSTFSLRNLFAKEDNSKDKEQEKEQIADYIPLNRETERKPINPLDTGEKNPFVYDSSDSECEEKETTVQQEVSEVKAVWRENLFFTKDDYRLKEGLLFFNKSEENGAQKERRGLKNIMKKRIYNKERKNQMFQKKIGGRKKSMKKSIRQKR